MHSIAGARWLGAQARPALPTWRLFLFAALAGFAAFFVFVGPAALDPRNIAWLEGGDPTQHYLGWSFFRNSPWAFPIGANPRYGIELATGIIYSDSIPLLAFAFKALSPWLSSPFQYFGFWLLACFILQGIFAMRLAALTGANVPARALFVVLLLFTPPLLMRLSGHFALCGHWLILAALCCCLSEGSRSSVRWAWIVLALLSALVHPYILLMVLALWVADLARRLLQDRLHPGTRVLEGLLVPAAAVVALWQAGAFLNQASVSTSGFGYYRMNLLSLVNPMGWSYVLPKFPTLRGDYEGFNFLGLGTLLLCVTAMPAVLRLRFQREWLLKWLPLIAVLALLTLFAISNHVAIADLDVEIPLPNVILDAANVFRSSGRLFWPVFYILVFATVWLVLRHHGRWATAILACAVVIQIVDTSAGWRVARTEKLNRVGSAWTTPLESPFWEQAARRYTRIRGLAANVQGRGYSRIAYFAARHGLATDSVYLARLSNGAGGHGPDSTLEKVKSGVVEPDTMYVLDEAQARQIRPWKRESDWLGPVDKWFVLAPGWNDCADCPQLPEMADDSGMRAGD